MHFKQLNVSFFGKANFLDRDDDVNMTSVMQLLMITAGRCRLKPADPPPPWLKARWLPKWGRPPVGHYFLTLINGGGSLCTVQRLKATCDKAL